VRQRLAYELWNRMSPDHVQIRAYNAVVFVDGQYHGLYVVSDHVDDELMAAHGFEKDGNLYKARTHNADFSLLDDDGMAKSSPHVGYTKEEGEPIEGEPDAFADLDELITWIASSSDEEFRDGVDARLARAEFEAWWMFVTAIEATDSAGKNHYLYHDPDPDAGDPLFHYVPWDFNASFGQNWRTLRLSPNVFFNTRKRNHVFERLLDEPRFAQPMFERFGELLRTAYAVDSVLALFDTWVEENDPSARRDQQKWGARYLEFDWGDREDVTGYAQEIEYVREWIRARWADLDAMY
jgi:spore coat protein CotH